MHLGFPEIPRTNFENLRCNLHWCYSFCTDVTLFALVLHLNCTALIQSESSDFFMHTIMPSIERNCNFYEFLFSYKFYEDCEFLQFS